MKIPLEDNLSDVLSKAARGLGLNATGLGRATGLNPNQIEAVLEGKFDSGIVARLAGALKLHGPSLFELATRAWYPEEVQLVGLAAFNTPCPVPGFSDMTVNSYLVWDPITKYAAAFDTGANVEDMLRTISAFSLRLGMICLTHAHHDHVKALQPLLEATGHPPVRAHEREKFAGAEPFKAGTSLSIGYLQVETCLTSGHSPGGTSYVISGLAKPLAIVGDALFCCSMGGAAGHYQQALDQVRNALFSLPEETILCPGHGPMTTVREELLHNPFFANAD